MVKAVVLVKSPKKLIAARLKKIDFITISFPVSGQFDAVAIIEVNDLSQIKDVTTNIQKITDSSVRFNLIIDPYSLLNITINEVGLFMRNPRGNDTPNPILVAYRPFTSLAKTSTFTLILKWTISF